MQPQYGENASQTEPGSTRTVPGFAFVMVLINLYFIETWVRGVYELFPGASIRPMGFVGMIFLTAIFCAILGIIAAIKHAWRHTDRFDRIIAGLVFLTGLSVLPVFLFILWITEKIIGYELAP